MKTNREFIGRHPFIREQPISTNKKDMLFSNIAKRVLQIAAIKQEPLYPQPDKTCVTPRLHGQQFVAAGPMTHESIQATSVVLSPAVCYFTPAPETIVAIVHEDDAKSDEQLVMSR
jgi:hypothetical protein